MKGVENVSKYNYGTAFLSGNYTYNDKEKNIRDYVQYMLNRSLAMFQYHNLPETIKKNNLEMMLQCNGFCGFAKCDNKLYVFNGGLGGVPNEYNEPTEFIVANPYLKFNKTLTINEDCVIMKNDVLQMGLLPIFNRYCTMLAENDITMILATVNKRIQNIISANDDNTAESARQFLKQVFDGKLGIITETKLFDSLKTQNGNSTNAVTMRELCEFQQYIKSSLYNEIGINANTNMKREHLITDEVDMNSENLYPLVDTMLECRRTALEKVNEMFGTNILVEFNSSWDYRLFNGEPIQTALEGSKIGTEDETIFEPTEETNVEPIIETDIEPTEETTIEATEENDISESDETEDTEEPTEVNTEPIEDVKEVGNEEVEDTEENATEDEQEPTEDTEERGEDDEEETDSKDSV